MSSVEFEEDRFSGMSQKTIQQIEPTPEKGLESFLYKHLGINASLTKIVLVSFALLSFFGSIIFFMLASYNFNLQNKNEGMLLEERVSETRAKEEPNFVDPNQ